MNDDKQYEPVKLSDYEEGAEDLIYNVLADWVDTNDGETVDEQRILLPKLLNYNEEATAYVESNMPEGIERVDGGCIRPILKKVVNDVLASLPQPEITDEV